jgi:uncharacterized protein YdhG (YjbR/CyaY superfamily)
MSADLNKPGKKKKPAEVNKPDKAGKPVDVNMSEKAGKPADVNTSETTNKPAEGIPEYITAQPEAIQPILHQVYQTLREVLPNVQERMSWGMPTFWHKHNIIHFAAFKQHFSIFPGPEAIVFFTDKLKPYRTSKGAIQFPYNQPVPTALIAEIAKWCHATGHHH